MADLDWIQEVQDLVKLRAICASLDPGKVRANFHADPQTCMMRTV